ncbi:DUF5996 family protein [Mesorhizobium sp. J428]|nr:DUF5996 family protein [Mesorhizobium sp. J428]MCR5856407.1 DUF5996 family protein [Mesorhizobium sp. J428]
MGHDLGEFLLPYEAVRRAKDPAATLMKFLQTTFDGAALLGNWPSELAIPTGKPLRPRATHR